MEILISGKSTRTTRKSSGDILEKSTSKAVDLRNRNDKLSIILFIVFCTVIVEARL